MGDGSWAFCLQLKNSGSQQYKKKIDFDIKHFQAC